ncbi:apiosidase-like domain-containing protein [Intrasporangium mesophilum]
MAAVLAIGIVVAGCSVPMAATSAIDCSLQSPSETAGASTAFPLTVEHASRHLVDRSGRPFLMVGDAAWSVIAQLDEQTFGTYLCLRREAGFNTIMVNLIEHKFASNAPANAQRQAPFLAPGDFSRPNAAYFDSAARMVSLARSWGFLVIMTPAYAGYDGGSEGWYQEMARSGAETLHAYGRFVGQRFRAFDNIIWVEGGDYDVPDPGLVDALAEGVAETDPHALQTYNGRVDSRVTPAWGDRPWFSIDNIYTYKRPMDAASAAYRDGTKPFFLLESLYENEHNTTPVDLRRQSYQTVLCGGIGHVFGNNPMWHFDGPGLFPAPSGWTEQFDSPGTKGMTQFAHILGSVDWWKLRPDSGSFLVGSGSAADPTVSSVATDRTLAVAYDPDGAKLLLDLSALAGPLTSAVWRDPVSGASAPVDLPGGAAVQVTVSPPGANSGGDPDWVLVLEASYGPTSTTALDTTKPSA